MNTLFERATQLFSEAWPLARLWILSKQVRSLPQDSCLAFCYDVLNKVSRSFAVVIRQLPSELRDSVCVFYLVLRALDTIEDDMTLPNETKLPVLKTFHRKIRERGWHFQAGTGDYAMLLANHKTVTDVFLRLSDSQQQIIEEITEQMGNGMAKFIEQDVISLADYDLYCHYVAGLVGIGLSKLFCTSGLENFKFAAIETLSNDMGLFLQKVNITRDYCEDITEQPHPRMFWPKEIWGNYGNSLAEFQEKAHLQNAVYALNDMVTNALQHAPACLEYLSHIRNPGVFRFCAIPQVMAVATLAEIYNNPKVFSGVVKVRRGLVASYMMGINDMTDLLQAFIHFGEAILRRSQKEAAEDPKAKLTQKMARSIIEQARSRLQVSGRVGRANKYLTTFVRILVPVLLAAIFVWLTSRADLCPEAILGALKWLLPTFGLAFLLTYKKWSHVC